MALDVDRVREIAERVGASTGLEIVEVELRGGGKARMLRIFIDKSGGVTHEDCANLSREVGTILDVEDVIPGGSYLLEVSNGSRHFEGRLESFQQGRLTIEMNAARKKPRLGGGSQKLEIELANVEKANLVPEI
ncbi:MAG: hypothetical protein AUI17_02215 [Acidobacteriales bacterium 13_2_20CM_2_55_5]|nr:MAG: hypothetical protein AUI17_02215 [Acidobacteriales bacterium 13_2_20CM_2_55_5]